MLKKKNLKFLLALFAGALLLSGWQPSAQIIAKDVKYGLVTQIISTQTLELFNIDADRKEVVNADISFYGLMYEQLYFDQFGLGTTLVKGVRNVEFKIDQAGTYKLQMDGDIYHLMLSFFAYTSKNKHAGFANVFEASIGYFSSPITFKTDQFYYIDNVTKQTEIINDFEEKITVSYFSTSFLYKMDMKTREWGARIGLGITTGGSFDKVDFDLDRFVEPGTIGLRSSFNNALIFTLELYSFD